MNSIVLNNKENLNISVNYNDNSSFTNGIKMKAICGMMAISIISSNIYSLNTVDLKNNKKIQIAETNVINKTYANAYNGLESNDDLIKNSLEVKYMEIDNLRDNIKKVKLNKKDEFSPVIDFSIEDNYDFVSSISPIRKTDIKLKVNNKGKLPIKYNWEV